MEKLNKKKHLDLENVYTYAPVHECGYCTVCVMIGIGIPPAFLVAMISMAT